MWWDFGAEMSQLAKQLGHPKHIDVGEQLTQNNYYYSHVMAVVSQEISLYPINSSSLSSYPDQDHHPSGSKGRGWRPLNSRNVFVSQD